MAPLNPARYEELQDAEDIINYMFAEPSLLHEALQASGCESPDGNKRLALVGDAVLKLALVAEGHDRDESRARINHVLSTKASNFYLAHRGFVLGLDRYVDKCQSQLGTPVSPKIMATTMEAIIGAVFLDSGNYVSALTNVLDALGLSWSG
ncbi:RNAse III [Aspergillus sclerotialis]|uniref:RNAse III n=1 Tax=Aspergillus sclerotialis TaxID=2070753 RepID=A0A3A2ZJP6_9EURO|nr:RNAse III [Aspergillus sclerotialis]